MNRTLDTGTTESPTKDTAAMRNPLQQHYTPQEVAKKWRVSTDTVIRELAGEPGVLMFGSEEPKLGRKRGKRTIRIPESVLRRMYERRTRR